MNRAYFLALMLFAACADDRACDGPGGSCFGGYLPGVDAAAFGGGDLDTLFSDDAGEHATASSAESGALLNEDGCVLGTEAGVQRDADVGAHDASDDAALVADAGGDNTHQCSL